MESISSVQLCLNPFTTHSNEKEEAGKSPGDPGKGKKGEREEGDLGLGVVEEKIRGRKEERPSHFI